MDVHERLKKVISDSKLSLPNFAKMVGVSTSTLIRYRDGDVSPSIDFLERVCNAFDLDLIGFLSGKTCSEKKPSIDIDILTEVISGVEEGLSEMERVLEPGKKAQLIALLYDHYASTEEEVREEVVGRYLKLAI